MLSFLSFDARRISTRLYLGFALPAISIITVGTYALYSFGQINHKVGTIYDDRIIPLEQLKLISDNYAISIIDTVNKAHAGQLSQQTALSQVRQAQTTIDDTWDTYLQTYLTPREAQLAKEVNALFEKANPEIERLVATLETGSTKDLDAFDGYLYQIIDPLTTKIQELIDIQLQVAEQERIAAEALYQQTRAVFLALLAGALVLASPAGYLFSRVITKTLKETTEAVAHVLNEIATATEEHERIAAQQASAVRETTTALDQLSSFARNSAYQAESVAQKSQQSRLLTEDGAKSAQTNLHSMSSLRENVEGIAEQIKHLNEQAQQIGFISSSVSDIANQTNMLALNASVEAVRAGQQGQGFAVVAKEIRKLADQSKQSSERISLLVNEIQKSVQLTVLTTATGTHSAQDSLVVFQANADVFTQVAAASEEVVISGQQISLSAEQQAKAIQEVLQTMHSLNAAASETAQSIAQTRQGTHRLKETMERLKAMV
ncbi:MAG TPA: methyl-accepting chemotaxis protein [Trichocoleus sp.]